MARRGEQPPIGLAWMVTWPLSAAFAALVFLAAEELRHPRRDVVVPPPAIGGADWNARFPDRIAAVDAALRKAPLRLPKPVEDARGSGPLRWTHRLYAIQLTPDEHAQAQAQAQAAVEALRGVDPGLAATSENSADGTDVRVGLDGLLVSTLRFRWAAAHVAPTPGKPRLAMVIGPLGDDLRLARQVVAIEAPVALGVRPFRPFSREVAELGRIFNREVLVQLDDSEGANATGGADGGGEADLEAVLASVPQALGVAWQGGGRGGSARDRRLLEAINQRQLLYVGGGRRGAGGPPLPVPAVIADGLPEAVAAQLAALADRARADGSAIGIGAPSETTLQTLAQVLPEWQAAEIEVVPVSALAGAGNLSAR